MTQIITEFPEKLRPLFEPHRYKVLRGGRGSMKSWTVARALLEQADAHTLQVLCAREYQSSIATRYIQPCCKRIEVISMPQT